MCHRCAKHCVECPLTEPPANSVACGSDYLATAPGTLFDFGPGIGTVNFMGLPLSIDSSNADTIVQRTTDIPLNVNPSGGPPTSKYRPCR
jgi:hypothetical protein